MTTIEQAARDLLVALKEYEDRYGVIPAILQEKAEKLDAALQAKGINPWEGA